MWKKIAGKKLTRMDKKTRIFFKNAILQIISGPQLLESYCFLWDFFRDYLFFIKLFVQITFKLQTKTSTNLNGKNLIIQGENCIILLFTVQASAKNN